MSIIERCTSPWPKPTLTNLQRRAEWAARYYAILRSGNAWTWKWMRK